MEYLKTFAQGKTFTLNKNDYSLMKVVYRNNELTIYTTKRKAVTKETKPPKWEHSTVIRLTKLSNSEEKIRSLLDLSELRIKMNYDSCPDLVRFYDQNISKYGDNLYHIIRYDDPLRTFEDFVLRDHQNSSLEPLDCFRIARGALSAFAYLEENNYVLTQFDAHNLYIASFSEDRRSPCKIMFKGYAGTYLAVNSCIARRHKFSPPETETQNIYRSYLFSLGLMILYAIFYTNDKADMFPLDLYNQPKKIKGLIPQAIQLLHKKKGAKNGEKKPSAIDKVLGIFKPGSKKTALNGFLEDLLEVDFLKRKTPRELLSSAYILKYDELDYKEYKKEVHDYLCASH